MSATDSGDFQGRAYIVSHVDGVSDMSLICWLCGSVRGGLRKGTMASAFLSGKKLFYHSCLDDIHFIYSLYVTGAFQTATPVLELRWSESE